MSRWLRGVPAVTGGRLYGRTEWRFEGGAAYEIGALGSGWVIEVPETFTFDVSIPWWIAWLVPAWLKRAMTRAAGLHDFARCDPVWTLWFGNLLFLDALKVEGVREPFLTLCWQAVRLSRRRD